MFWIFFFHMMAYRRKLISQRVKPMGAWVWFWFLREIELGTEHCGVYLDEPVCQIYFLYQKKVWTY